METNSYQDRQADRKAALMSAAEKARAEGEGILDRVRSLRDAIPLGQPIMGARDRSARERLNASEARGYQRLREASEYERRAKALGTAGIASDDPDAPDKLRAKIDTLTRVHETMKAVRRAVRAGQRAGLDHEAMVEKIAAVDGMNRDKAERVLVPDPMGNVGFPDYAIANSSARIRAAKKRLAEVESLAQDDDTIDTGGDGWHVELDDGRLVLSFDHRIPADAYRQVRRLGFVAARSRVTDAWPVVFVRKDTANARTVVRRALADGTFEALAEES